MKTLNEVIAELEDEGVFPDALHYLKEYRNCGDCAYADSYLRCTTENRNEPLTWDELQQMDEKSIWIEVKNGEKKWVLTWNDPDNADRIIITDAYGLRGPLNKSMYLKGEIQAYRKERNENA